jgi:DNA-binding NtrC family response regulator
MDRVFRVQILQRIPTSAYIDCLIRPTFERMMGSSKPHTSPFRHRRILVVEDEAFIAEELKAALERQEGMCLGPYSDVGDALECAMTTTLLDAAILDVNVGGKLTFDLADTLTARGIPIVFWTGYDKSILPARFAERPWCEKPMAVENLTSIVANAIFAPRVSSLPE